MSLAEAEQKTVEKTCPGVSERDAMTILATLFNDDHFCNAVIRCFEHRATATELGNVFIREFGRVHDWMIERQEESRLHPVFSTILDVQKKMYRG